MRKHIITTLALLLSLVLYTEGAFAQDEQNLSNVSVSNVLDQSAQTTNDKFSLEVFSYEEYLYSQSRKTEVGDKMKLNGRFRYQVNDEAWMSVGFKTDPRSDRTANKTSDFELRAGYRYEQLSVQADFSLNTNDPDGGISFGLDVDSENTFLRYKYSDAWQLTFFPFNFDGDVGVEFETGDVTKIHYVNGTPSNITTNPNPNDPAERIITKTVPGFELKYSHVSSEEKFVSFYLGLGVATYEYPNNPAYDISQTSAGATWARRETFGYKLGGILRGVNSFTSFQYVGHTEDAETGSLLESAGSIYNLSRVGRFMIEAEITASKGGSQPYRIDASTAWFDTSDPAFVPTSQRVYRDSAQNLQDWVNDWGAAASFKFGVRREGYTPYFSYKYQSDKFVFEGRESAHILRTNDLSESHGGLHRIGAGAYVYKGKFVVNPRFEYLMAKNNVFSDNALLQNSNIPSTFTDSDFVFFLNVSYFYDKKTGPRTFRL